MGEKEQGGGAGSALHVAQFKVRVLGRSSGVTPKERVGQEERLTCGGPWCGSCLSGDMDGV